MDACHSRPCIELRVRPVSSRTGQPRAPGSFGGLSLPILHSSPPVPLLLWLSAVPLSNAKMGTQRPSKTLTWSLRPKLANVIDKTICKSSWFDSVTSVAAVPCPSTRPVRELHSLFRRNRDARRRDGSRVEAGRHSGRASTAIRVARWHSNWGVIASVRRGHLSASSFTAPAVPAGCLPLFLSDLTDHCRLCSPDPRTFWTECRMRILPLQHAQMGARNLEG
jgi:hypothetical protein